MITISLLVIVMNKKEISLLICLILLLSLTMGCLGDDGDKKKSNKAPTCDLGPDLEVLSNTDIQFSSENCSDPDGEIVSYAWDFKDYRHLGAETSDEANPKYTYQWPGEFKTTLTITDDDGKSAIDILNVTVLNRAPLASAGAPETVKVYEVVYLNGTAQDLDGYIIEYEWDFDGDGDYDWFASTTGMTTHFYDSPGNYQAILTVTDNLFAQTVVAKNITVIELHLEPPIADAGSDQVAPIGQVLLKGTGFDPDGNIELYEWDFNGDGKFDWNSSDGGIVYYGYTVEGIFNANLRVTDDSGLSATDTVTIEINNSIITKFIEAQIFINWNTSYDYIVIFNNTIETSELKVVITDIVSDTDEIFFFSSMIQNNLTSYGLSSALEPVPNHSLQIEVFYYRSLVGARALDIVNQSYEFLGPELDFSAIYDVEQFVEERDVVEAEILRITSIGDLEFRSKGNLYYTSLHGTGTYYVYDSFDGGTSETKINSTDLWANVTLQGSEIISESISLNGYGDMTINYEDDFILDMYIEEFRMKRENDVDIENFIYAEGTFSSTTIDPFTNMEIITAGEVYFTSELLGTSYIENWEGEEYFCSIQRVNVTLEGESGSPGSFIKTQFTSTVVNTTWNVDYLKYSNNTIYYEYTSVMTVANLEEYDAGSDYPVNHPTVSKPSKHINDMLIFDTPRPRILTGEDFIVLESTEGVKLQLTVTGELEATINNKKYDCVDLRGDCIEGATGYIETRIIRSGPFIGLMVFEKEDFRWNNEWLKGEMQLKSIK